MKLEQLLDPDKLKRTRLRKMKLLAGSLLAIALVIFIICSIWSRKEACPTWVGYVKAAAEAGMVGGLADWFAVTALFRHPLGLPIPHTAIIPKKKDQLGDTLASFVKDNFLTVDTVSQKIASSNIPVQIGKWLIIPENSQRVATELIKALTTLLDSIKTEDLVKAVESTLENKAPATVWSPKLGEYLEESVQKGEHNPLVQLLVDNIYEWVLKSEQKLQDLLGAEAPSWAPKIVKDLIFGKIYAELIDFVTAIKENPDHQARQALNQYLISQTEAMQHDEKTIKKLTNWQEGLIEKGNIAKLTETTWQVIRDSLQNQLADTDSKLNQVISNKGVDIANELTEDTQLQAKVNNMLIGAVSYLVDNYADQLLTVITDTIKNWDGKEAASKLELNVGRDLQFIRINGTIVGSIVGLIIYTLAQVVV